MSMLNHIIISASHGSLSPKKAVDHTSDPATLPPPPPSSARVRQPMDLCAKRDDYAYALSTVCHPSDLHGHRKSSHICERVVYAWRPFFGGRCCWYTSHTHNAFKQEVLLQSVLHLTSYEILSSCSQLCCRPSSYVLRGITGGSLARIDILSKVDEEQYISSQTVPPASFMTQRCTVTIWSLYHCSSALVSISRIDQFTSLPCFGCVMAPA